MHLLRSQHCFQCRFQCVLSIIFSWGWQFIRLAEGSSSRRRAGLMGQDPLFPFVRSEVRICPLSPHRCERWSTVLLEDSSCQIHCVEHVLTNALRYAGSLSRARPLSWELISTQYFTNVPWSRCTTLFQICRHRPQRWGVLPRFMKQRQRLA